MRKNDTRVFLDLDSLPERIDSIADDLRRRYGHLAEVSLEAPEHHFYSVVPVNPRACSFSFILDQWLDLFVDGGRWELDWTEEGIALFHELTESVIAGRVVSYQGRRKTVVEVTLDSGQVEKSTAMEGFLGVFEGRAKPKGFEPWASGPHHPEGL